ncbi:MAG: DinB family protein [Candidatus Solibacter usitatus]|nr:DinB family protein [Candidatus Solibacter usitatus]
MRPDSSEYSPYYGRYISLAPDDVMEALQSELRITLSLLDSIREERADYRYAEDKWSIRQVVGHLIDTERVFAFRALWFGRNDPTPLASMDQDLFMRDAGFDNVPLRELAAEFASVRDATIHLFRNMPEAAFSRIGKVQDAHMSVNALAYMIAGHEMHHRAILRDRYRAALE